jgi:hypothetical protein
MNLYPTSFYVWRPTAGAYLYYTTIYDEGGNVVRFVNAEPPVGFGQVHIYDQAFTHEVAIKRSPQRLRFHDLYEVGCVNHTTITEVSTGFTHSVREIPIMSPDTCTILPRELAATPATIVV